jgi:hypothetical protein
VVQTYRRLLPLGRVRKAAPLTLLLFSVVAFLDATWLNGLFTNINSYSQAFGCAILLTLAMVHIARLTLQSPFTLLEKQPGFFCSVAVLVYCSCSIAFGRHKQFGHGSNIYEENIKVPLILINPLLFNGKKISRRRARRCSGYYNEYSGAGYPT